MHAQFLRCLLAAFISASLLLSASSPSHAKRAEPRKETAATEDLMREHGILCRILLVYRQSAARLRQNPASVDKDALIAAAALFRDFGEDYHERLEETHVFPVVRKLQGSAADYPLILVDQHQRGRIYTDAILAYAGKDKLTTDDAAALATILENMASMYQNHAAREDTIVFPAWKRALTARRYKEMGDLFERIEVKRFGLDGFEKAAAQIAAIENKLGYSDLAQFTAPVLSCVDP
ncbi:MAG: hemerythrin domain-containing protein [Alphaproteobacteria bacterium]|nr:hemerythrin domain-containing protein [Alphaproteobacteria bacterium]